MPPKPPKPKLPGVLKGMGVTMKTAIVGDTLREYKIDIGEAFSGVVTREPNPLPKLEPTRPESAGGRIP